MNEFFKTILLSFVPDKTSLNTVTTKLSESVSKAFETSSLGKILADGFSAAIKGDNFIKTMLNSSVVEFGNIVNDALNELDNMLQYSQFSSSRTRELAFGYGFSSSEAFAYERALEAVGLTSMEDLMYANTQEQKQFREAFTKYSEKYDELYDSGFFEKMQEYQFEMQDFKFEMQQEIIEFFINNKDIIMTVMTSVIEMSEAVLTGFAWLIDFFDRSGARSSSDRAAATSDIISQYSTSKSTNVNIDNTFNNVSKIDQPWLARAGSVTYEQIIKALK